jgi:hypothetical protein
MTKVFEDIQIDAEFAALIPPLSAEERQQLEENIVEHGGARDLLVVWASKGTLTLLDGHNRYEICTRLELPFEIEEMRFSDRSHAEEWIIRNQFGRRNLSAYVRTQLALRLEETVAARAKANQGKRTDIPQKSAECINPVETRKEIAKVANVSHDTVAKVKRIEEATAQGLVTVATIEKLRSGEISINHVDKEIKKQRAEVRAVEKKKEAVMAGEWIACEDYLPQVGKCVIAFDPEVWRETGSCMSGADSNAGEWWGNDGWRVAGQPANVTHWMPFPHPPTGGQDGW